MGLVEMKPGGPESQDFVKARKEEAEWTECQRLIFELRRFNPNLIVRFVVQTIRSFSRMIQFIHPDWKNADRGDP